MSDRVMGTGDTNVIWRRFALFLALGLAAWVSPAIAHTWLVDADPANPVDRIGQVVLQAVAGDTVLVGPGTYFEHVPLDGKSLVLRSTSGADATVLDGSVPIEGRDGSIAYLRSASASDQVTISGFTLTHGQGTVDDLDHRVGGALALLDWIGSLRVEDCVFADNRISGGSATGGGAMYLMASEAAITNCRFQGNAPGTGGMGGDLLLNGGITIDHCAFDVASEAQERGVCIWSRAHDLTITDSDFRSTGGTDESITSWGTNVSLLRNRFIATGGRLATNVTLSTDAAGIYHQSFRISENLFWNEGPDEAGWQTSVTMGGPNVHIQMDHNDFVGCGISCYFDGDPLECHHNIFYKSRFDNLVPPSVATCNCVSDSAYWQPSQYSQLEYEDMVFADPIFCGPDTGNFYISIHSPCAPGNSPDGCGLIGLYPADCDITPVQETSWGRIKARFLAR